MIEGLKNLPDVSFIDNVTLDDIQAQMKRDYEEKYEELTGAPCHMRRADPTTLLLHACSIQIFQALLYVDRAGKQDLLKYSYGEYLDNLAAIRGIVRLPAKPSVTTVRFTLSDEMPETKIIPKGTIVTNGDTYFQTDEYAEIKAGEISTEVACTCQIAGSAGNKIPEGAINILVDVLPYIESVQNTDATSGGADREDDDSLADRIYLAPASYSVAGPDDAYEYFAYTFSQDITSVKVSSPAPAEVEIRFLVNGGEIPTKTMIKSLENHLNNADIRPLTDRVSVLAPEQKEFDIKVTYCINKSDTSRADSIKTEVESAISKYIEWQTGTIGRDINPSELTKRIMEAGAKRCEVALPAFEKISDSTVPRLKTKTVTYGEIEDD